MSDDFGTVSVRRGDRARELEVMRQRYRAHREALQRMVEDAPTDHLATEYQRLIGDLDTSLAKLDELEGRGGTAAAPPQPPPPRSTMSAGDRPLASLPSDLHDQPTVVGTAASPNPASRVAIIIIGGVIVLAAIVFLIWRGSERKGTTPVVEAPSVTQTADTAASSTAPEVTPVTQTTAPAASSLKITPLIADYGVIRKGTRAVRQFEVFNNGAAPITIQLARSSCRCLFYDYHDKVAPQKKETITVTVDGAKAKAGALRETLPVTVKGNTSLHGELTVQATIQ
jgi:hypothetical protein